MNRPSEIRFQDPLSDVTRAERKTLLGVSTIGIIIANSGLVPSKISALGVDFDRADQTAILRMLSAVVVYFLLAFIIYAASDLIGWRASFHRARSDWIRLRVSQGEEEERKSLETEYRYRRWSVAGRPMSVIRAIFEFAVPVIIAVYAVVALASAPPPKNEIRTSPAYSD